MMYINTDALLKAIDEALSNANMEAEKITEPLREYSYEYGYATALKHMREWLAGEIECNRMIPMDENELHQKKNLE